MIYKKFESVPFYRSCGAEYTYVDPKEFTIPVSERLKIVNRWYELSAKDMQALHTSSFGGTFDPSNTAQSEDDEEIPERGVFHQDPGCVEYSTPVCTDWDEMRGQFEYGLAIAEMHDLQLQSENVCSGMGHVNIGVTRKEAGKVLFDIVERPYVALAFCRPSELSCCMPSIAVNANDNVLAWGFPRSYPHNSGKYVDIGLRGDRGMRFGQYLEFRMFSSPEDWEEASAHIALAQRYVQSIARASLKPRAVTGLALMAQMADRFRSFDYCLSEFKRFIEDLGLPWSYYSRYATWMRLNHRLLFSVNAPYLDRSWAFTRYLEPPAVVSPPVQTEWTFMTAPTFSTTIVEFAL